MCEAGAPGRALFVMPRGAVYDAEMQPVRMVLLPLVFVLLAPLSCSRRQDPTATPIAAPTAPPPAIQSPAPAPAPVPDSAVDNAAAAAEPPVEETPTPCQRACSSSANKKQTAAYVRCEAKPADREACREKALAATDAERAACRRACDQKQPGSGK